MTSPTPPPGMTNFVQRPLQIMAKDWAHNKVLDNHVKPEAYITWRDRALDHLARDRLDVRHLLLWAEKEKSEMSLEMVAQKIRATGSPRSPRR